MEKVSKIENFIGIYDNYILEQDCKNVIKFFEREAKFNQTVNRQVFENAPVLQKSDDQYFAGSNNLKVWWTDLKNVMINFDIAWNKYLNDTGAKEAYGCDFNLTQIKIQKTLPTQGYHKWHIEHNPGYESQKRAFVYSIYLNDVDEGGETEFLHYSKRVKPKTGRIVIWPAGFPYIHRGNPPLSGEKYIITSWMIL